MRRQRRETCSEFRCDAPNQKFGLCEEHYDDREERLRRDGRAVGILHYEERPEHPSSPDGGRLAGELDWIRGVWGKYCTSVNFPPGRLLSSDERIAQDLCVAYTARIVRQMDELNSGAPLSEAPILRESGIQEVLSPWDK